MRLFLGVHYFNGPNANSSTLKISYLSIKYVVFIFGTSLASQLIQPIRSIQLLQQSCFLCERFLHISLNGLYLYTATDTLTCLDIAIYIETARGMWGNTAGDIVFRDLAPYSRACSPLPLARSICIYTYTHMPY